MYVCLRCLVTLFGMTVPSCSFCSFVRVVVVSVATFVFGWHPNMQRHDDTIINIDLGRLEKMRKRRQKKTKTILPDKLLLKRRVRRRVKMATKEKKI